MTTATKPTELFSPSARLDTDEGSAPQPDACEQRARNAEALLDARPAAAFLLTAQSFILHANRAAAHLLRDADGVRADSGRLVAARTSRQSPLQECIFAAASAVPSSGALTLPRASGQRPLQALVAPLTVLDGAASIPRVLVLVTDPDAEICFAEAVLSALYGFTSAESEVANALLAGLSLEEIATRRHVARGTTRIQIKSLLRKTDCRRQADLVRLLMTVPRAASRSMDISHWGDEN